MANDSSSPESAPPEQSPSNSGPADSSIGSKSDGQVSSTRIQAATSASLVPAQTPTEDLNREHLLDRARSFLASPQVQNQDLPSKRAFLREKGLSEAEIENLLRTLVRAYPSNRPQTLNISFQSLHTPSIPPRTYPQPPPSNLPVLLLGIVRLFSWLAGGSAALIFFYRVRLCDNFLDTLADFVPVGLPPSQNYANMACKEFIEIASIGTVAAADYISCILERGTVRVILGLATLRSIQGAKEILPVQISGGGSQNSQRRRRRAGFLEIAHDHPVALRN